MEVICLEDDAFYSLIDRVINRLKDHEGIKEDKQILSMNIQKNLAKANHGA